MGSIVNGIAVHGGCVKPYGSTFLIFSDYMRPAVRLSALMGLPVVWAWTHDSVGLGEDGPTHQPVETYAALRAIPNLWFMRPADANETAVRVEGRARAHRRPGRARALAAEGADARPHRARAGVGARARRVHALGVVAVARPDPDRDRRRGRAGARGRPQARRRTGTAVRVVSMPCWELFDEQPADYRDEVLPPDVKARLSVEPGVALGWSQWVGDARRLDLDRALRRVGARARPSSRSSATTSTTSSRVRPRSSSGSRDAQAEAIKTFSRLVAPGFCLEGELPAVKLEGIEVRHDGHAIARVAGRRPRARRSASRSTRGGSPGSRCCESSRVAFDHRGVHLREAVLEALAGHEVDRLRHRHRRGAHRLPRQGARARRGDPATGEAERGVLVCGSGVGAAVAACKMAGIRACDLPRRLQRAPGCRARRHERALPRLGDRRAVARARARRRVSRRDLRRRRALRRAPGRRSRAWKGR